MKHKKDIYIIGAGAIGKVLAAFLKSEGRNVVILRGSIDNHTSGFEKVSVQLSGNETVEAEIEVSTLSNYSTLDGIVVLTNKSYGNHRLSEALKAKIGNSPVVVLQNGLNIERPFIDNGFSRIYRCVLFVSSQSLPESAFKFKPTSVSPVGIIKGNSEDLAIIVDCISTRYFLFRSEKNIQPIIWTKAIANSVFNSVCPLLETDNGIFHRDKKALDIAKRVIAECVTVAASQGISLNSDKVVDTLLLISKSTDGQFISTYQDIINRRKTEIETLNLAIAGIADQLNEKWLAKETRLLGELVQIKAEMVAGFKDKVI